MFRLTREVRFAVNASPGDAPGGAGPPGERYGSKPTNSYAGFPSLAGFGHYFALRVTVTGPLDPASQYLVNIKSIDAVARELAVPAVEAAVRSGGPGGRDAAGRNDSGLDPARLVARLFELLRPGWQDRGLSLQSLELSLSPFLCYSALAPELPMVRLSQKFEFSATHRLHNPALSDDENCQTFGKCNNPHGHGHNYELQVTLAGDPDAGGLLVDVPAFERVVAAAVVDRFDHKNLNVELPEFRDVIPTVENIARVIFRLLKPPFADSGAKLASVTVWETPKTWCEYSE